MFSSLPLGYNHDIFDRNFDLEIKYISHLRMSNNLFSSNELLDLDSYDNLGIIKNENYNDESKLDYFLDEIQKIKTKKIWKKSDFLDIFNYMIPGFDHKETNKYLDSKM